ncbi:MAG TPA: hypothetical protein VNO31_14515 [Umezawaea sp.]|nr:hypothetical protein [Umezawaea sp.]
MTGSDGPGRSSEHRRLVDEAAPDADRPAAESQVVRDLRELERRGPWT